MALGWKDVAPWVPDRSCDEYECRACEDIPDLRIRVSKSDRAFMDIFLGSAEECRKEMKKTVKKGKKSSNDFCKKI